jgi:hypothetical protein
MPDLLRQAVQLGARRSHPIRRTEAEAEAIAHVAGDYVQMDMKDILSCGRSVGQEQIDAFAAHAALAHGRSNLLADPEQMAADAGREIGQPSCVPVRDDKDVTRVDGLDVHEG